MRLATRGMPLVVVGSAPHVLPTRTRTLPVQRVAPRAQEFQSLPWQARPRQTALRFVTQASRWLMEAQEPARPAQWGRTSLSQAPWRAQAAQIMRCLRRGPAAAFAQVASRGTRRAGGAVRRAGWGRTRLRLVQRRVRAAPRTQCLRREARRRAAAGVLQATQAMPGAVGAVQPAALTSTRMSQGQQRASAAPPTRFLRRGAHR